MQWGQFFSILSAIVGVAGTTVIVSSPHTAEIMKAFGDAFSGSLRAAEGH